MNVRVLAAALAAGLCCAPAVHAEPKVSIPFNIANFSRPLQITNWYWAMAPGRHVIYYESEGGECYVNDWIVTFRSKNDFVGIYAGLAARVVTDNVYADDDCDGGRDRISELTSDWFAQDNAGNIWYMGEDTTAFEYDDAGHLINKDKEGTWESGRNGGRAGLIMLAHPVMGQYYRQEFEAGVAEDFAGIVRVGVPVNVGHNQFQHCLVTKEWTPLEAGDVEYKLYCPNVGLVRVVGAGINKGGGDEVVDLDLP
jgi:hypothetical protein